MEKSSHCIKPNVFGKTRIDPTFSVHSGLSTFEGDVRTSVLRVGDRFAADYCIKSGGTTVRRVGYDLFVEVKRLLTVGQPVSEALTPTLELHIALLRYLLTEQGVTFIEIPPRPAGFDFACCLTHDVDFFGLRRHRFDRTLGGFVARASLGTLLDAARGRRSMSEVARNWWALLSLPFVFLGVSRDPWQPFEDYARVEAGRPSTFFLVPHKEKPGTAPDGTVKANRAVRYQISQISEYVRQASLNGNEVAVHGIDAWRDSAAGRAELAELALVTGLERAGVRMHWLYFDEESAKHLENAGFFYDSTWGYNEAVGYRPGTSQVFRLLGSQDLMELPLSIMDSALFYRGRMGLSHTAAWELCRSMVKGAKRFGGTLVINWHGRSLAPERLWGSFYRDLLAEMEDGSAVWFATGDEAVRWFRWRRSIRFARESGASGAPILIAAERGGSPPATVWVHRSTETSPAGFETLLFDGQQELRIRLDE